MNNFERIKDMDIKELAMFLNNISIRCSSNECHKCPIGECVQCYGCTVSDIEDYLMQEAENET